MALAEPAVEEQHIDDVIAASEAELSRLEPEVDDAAIQGLVQTAYEDLMPAKVHNYMPLLIVRQVRDILHSRPVA